MSNTTQTEVLPPESRESIALTIPNADQLPPSMLTNIRDGFQSAFEQAESWREKALAIKVTSLADKQAKKAAAAPDKTKLLTIAASVRTIQFPTVSTPEAAAVLADIEAKRESFAKWIENQISTL